MKKKFSIGYWLLGLLVEAGARFFYKDLEIRGLDNFPADNKPTILIANHQNGMMDPLMCCVNTPRQLHFLTRADIFQKPLINKILRGLNMLPVYRGKDKVPNLIEKNKAIFRESYNRILSGNVISAFPEGNHNNQKKLRPFRKGVVRVAFGALELNHFEGDVQIVPVGIDYSNYTDFRSSILLNFGSPISCAQYLAEYQNDPAKTLGTLTKKLQSELSILVIDIRNISTYKNTMWACPWIQALNCNTSSYGDKYDVFKEFTVKADSYFDGDSEREELWNSKVAEIRALMGKNGIADSVLPDLECTFSSFQKMLGFVLLSPLSILGFILNGLPALFMSTFIKKKIKDPHFKSSILLSLGIVVFLFFYLIEGMILSSFMPATWQTVLLILAAPFLGVLTFDQWKIRKRVRAMGVWKEWKQTQQPDCETFTELRKDITAIIHRISNH